MTAFVDLSGNRYGRLLVLELARIENKKSVWICKCDCGTVKEMKQQVLGRSASSCGCLRREMTRARGQNNAKPFDDTGARNKLIDHYKRAAIMRGLSFELNFDDFVSLTKQNCYYCGTPPAQKYVSAKKCAPYIYNGIDRVVNSEGYNINNCVPCCKRCNQSKLAMSQSEFYEWIARVYVHSNLVNYHNFMQNLISGILVNKEDA